MEKMKKTYFKTKDGSIVEVQHDAGQKPSVPSDYKEVEKPSNAGVSRTDLFMEEARQSMLKQKEKENKKTKEK